MHNPKGFKGKYFSLAAILAFSTCVTLAADTISTQNTQANEVSQDEYSEDEELTPSVEELDVVVISKKIKTKESDATFASEIYTQKQIKKSRAKDIYEFLNTQSSIVTIPAFGNIFTQKIDMRGYGLGDGYENVVVTVDGRRLNAIDLSPQLLASIPLESIAKIEILKGSGSVEYGDGANAGAINIITKGYEGANIKSYLGSSGLESVSLGAGIKKEKFSISGYIDDYSSDGQKFLSLDGTKDSSWSRTKELKTTLNPIEDLTLNLGKSYSKMQLNYPNDLSLDEYLADPKSIPSSGYLSQYYSSDLLSYGVKYQILDTLVVDLQANSEKKVSDFITYSNRSKYEYDSYEAKLHYEDDSFKSLLGVYLFDGLRKGLSNTTSKENFAYYGKVEYAKGQNTFSLGARGEKVEYNYKANAEDLKDDYALSAFDIGYNYKVDKKSSLFININRSFQAPNIDRFFTFGGDFNSFIEPMKVNTLNLGYNYIGYPNKLKISAFYSDVKDEIYYNITTGQNTNLDKTRKYGFEVYDKYNIKYNLFATVNYAFVDTKIQEDSANLSVVGRDIPGVSKHNVKLGLGYNPSHRIKLLLNHIYKSSAYAIDDFTGVYGKMQSYNSTDFSATYTYKNYEIFLKVNNLLDRSNALFAYGLDYNTPYPFESKLSAYPINYERNFMLGFSAKF